MTRNRKNNDDTTDNFPKVGDGEDQVVDVSGQRWPGAQMWPRDRTITPPLPGRALPHRTPTMINAETGQALGDLTERAVARAAQRAALDKTLSSVGGPRTVDMLRHVFGTNLHRGPGTASAERSGYMTDRAATDTDRAD